MDTQPSVQMSQFLTRNNSSTNFNPTSNALSQQESNGNSCSASQLYLTVSNARNMNDNNSISSVKCSTKRTENNLHVSNSTSQLSPARCLDRRISTSFNRRLSIFVARRNTIFRHVHVSNQKAIRTLGVILGTCIVCWLPFMLFAIIKPLYLHITGLAGEQKHINAPAWLDSVLLWFGYSSSMLNPIIYSKFNREFRTPFREIMYCRCKGINEKIRRQEYLENIYEEENLLQPPAPPHMPTSIRNTGQPEAPV
jgi:5-hydroxytryptamine receptor 7